MHILTEFKKTSFVVRARLNDYDQVKHLFQSHKQMDDYDLTYSIMLTKAGKVLAYNLEKNIRSYNEGILMKAINSHRGPDSKSSFGCSGSGGKLEKGN